MAYLPQAEADGHSVPPWALAVGSDFGHTSEHSKGVKESRTVWRLFLLRQSLRMGDQ